MAERPYKKFEPLDNLYKLLEQMEQTLGISISSKDYKIGRHQLFYIFLHETTHAFITAALHGYTT